MCQFADKPTMLQILLNTGGISKKPSPLKFEKNTNNQNYVDTSIVFGFGPPCSSQIRLIYINKIIKKRGLRQEISLRIP